MAKYENVRKTLGKRVTFRSWGKYFCTGDSKALEELVTDYCIRDSNDEEELSADEDSECETEPATPSLGQTENGQTGNNCVRS